MDPISLALLGLPALYKGYQGIVQGNEADRLQKRDTTTEAEREALGLARQGASAGLPGAGQQLNRLNAGTASTLSAAERAGTSANSIMGLLSSADQTRSQGLADLATRQDAFHQQQQRGLVDQLQRKAQHEQRDQATFDQNKARLTEASQKNMYGALDGAAQIGLYAYQQKKEAEKPKTDAPTVSGAALGLSPAGPDYLGYGRKRYGVNSYGLDFGGYTPGSGYN